MIYPIAYVGLGSNLGDRHQHLAEAVKSLQAFGEIRAQSDWVETPPWGLEDQPAFLNGVVALQPTVGPWRLLEELLAIERKHGRIREIKWGPRTLDLDLLAFGTWQLHSLELTLPHPYATQRTFVLAPWSQIAPHFIINGRSVKDWEAILKQNP